MFLGVLALLSAKAPSDGFDLGPDPLIMRHPTLSKSAIVFSFAGDLWSVSRQGGEAHRLTAGPGPKSNPYFSPDGSSIAFDAEYDGNLDVFTVPSEGGTPRRLTSHPTSDVVRGWSPDGKYVLYSSDMLSNTDHPRLFEIPAAGGMPKPLPFPSTTEACLSPDSSKLAYVPHDIWEPAWKRYRGGQTTPVWIGRLLDSRVSEIPRKNTNDKNPMWIGDSIYYLSDPTGPVGMFRYDTSSQRVSDVIPPKGFDIKSACAGPGAIVYEKPGSIWLYDLSDHTSHRVPIAIHGDFLEVRPEFKNVSGRVGAYSISPTGKRIVVDARGWIFTVPASKGDTRVLDGAQGVHRREPAWSPDGKTIAYITDEGGTQRLELYDTVKESSRKVELDDPPAFYDSPVWSPDSKKIAYTDTKLNLWYLDVATGKSTLVDTGTYRGRASIDPKWSPDSQWLTWSRDLVTHYTAVFVYGLATGAKTQLTDGMVDANSPAFDRDGKTLYFLASTDLGLAADFEDLESLATANVTSSVYAVVLRKALPNPLQPESDEETGSPAAKPEAPKTPAPFGIDLDHIERRIIALPIPSGIYTGLDAGPEGSLFVLSEPPRPNAGGFGGPGTLHSFKFSDRKFDTFAVGVNGFHVSADGSKMLLGSGGSLRIVSTAAPPPPGEGNIDLSQLLVKIDPHAEWQAMYHEAWRTERLLFYDAALHGIDSAAMERRYEPLLANLCSREDLNYIFIDMLGEICVGHMFIGGGDEPRAGRLPGGLLGADLSFENGHYRITRIYDGERWNPELYAPLAQPGINAEPGEYLLAVDGHELTDSNDIYEQLKNKAGKLVKIKLGPTPDGKGSREVTVKPVGSEGELRFRAWTEDNRRLVEKLTRGRAGYVHVPDTSVPGWEAFNRYYYAQSDKQGMIVDDRFNHGGFINDLMVREMEKPLDFGSITRHGHDIKIPIAAAYGPKVMLINEMAGSGGDIFPFLFRQHKVGKLIGKRTWGAMLSAYGFELIDGGSIRAPDDAMYNPFTNKWIIENEGTPPDIDVELDPYLWRQGKDAQLLAAIDEINKEMDARKPVEVHHPPYPDKSRLPFKAN